MTGIPGIAIVELTYTRPTSTGFAVEADRKAMTKLFWPFARSSLSLSSETTMSLDFWDSISFRFVVDWLHAAIPSKARAATPKFRVILMFMDFSPSVGVGCLIRVLLSSAHALLAKEKSLG